MITMQRIPKKYCIITDKHLKLKINENTPFINETLFLYLQLIKKKINKYTHEWNIYKKYTNTYEYIHTHITQYSTSISQIKPVSRAFYKLIEIINTFKLFDDYKGRNIKTFHLAEAPGGFIEATSFLRNNKNDEYFGITLSNKHNIPSWKPSTLVYNKNIFFDTGVDSTGDLYNHENLVYFSKQYKDQFDFVTADGGIDFSSDFENQELMALKLILCEIFYAITILKNGGNFVIKFFDIFYKPTVECICLLSILFKKVTIIKPATSRTANSEKYIVCENLNIKNKDVLIKKFYNILKVINKLDNCFSICSFLDIPLNQHFINKIEEFNCILSNKQIKNILKTIKLIVNNDRKNDKIDNLKNNNIKSCISWCVNNNIPYNNKYKPVNIFLNKKI